MKFGNSYLILLAFGFWLLASEILSAQTFIITPAVTNVTCPGGNNGSASVSVSGGTIPYTYLWSDAAFQNTSLATGLSAGNYSVTITDHTGIDSAVSIIISEPPPFKNDSKAQSPECTNNGNIILNISGGTSPYNFLWNTGQVNTYLTGLASGDYSVKITDANNCTVSFPFSLLQGECFVTPEDHFTPNGDGINDTWSIANSEYYPDAKVIVFDRWGTRVYEHIGLYEAWNGKSYLGIPVPDAVYYYFFYEDKNDKEKKSTYGSVTIIR